VKFKRSNIPDETLEMADRFRDEAVNAIIPFVDKYPPEVIYNTMMDIFFAFFMVLTTEKTQAGIMGHFEAMAQNVRIKIQDRFEHPEKYEEEDE
jgi:hypothetical protein